MKAVKYEAQGVAIEVEGIGKLRPTIRIQIDEVSHFKSVRLNPEQGREVLTALKEIYSEDVDV